jgi:predicted nucleotidyltransferase
MDQTYVEIAKRFAKKASALFPAQKILLFGSCAKGTQTPSSDIDIAVIVKAAPVDYLRAQAALFSLVYETDHRIEPILLVKGHDRSGFIETVTREGVVVYTAS